MKQINEINHKAARDLANAEMNRIESTIYPEGKKWSCADYMELHDKKWMEIYNKHLKEIEL